MNITKIYESLIDAKKHGSWELIDELIEDIELQMRHDAMKGVGRLSQQKAAERILKNSVKMRTPEEFHYAQINENLDEQWITDSYKMVVFPTGHHLQFPPAPENCQSTWDYRRLFDNMYDSANRIELMVPDVCLLKNHIKIDKAKHKGEKGYAPVYDYGEGLPRLNAQGFVDILEAIPNAKMWTFSTRKFNPVFFENSDGIKGMLMPMGGSR